MPSSVSNIGKYEHSKYSIVLLCKPWKHLILDLINSSLFIFSGNLSSVKSHFEELYFRIDTVSSFSFREMSNPSSNQSIFNSNKCVHTREIHPDVFLWVILRIGNSETAKLF